MSRLNPTHPVTVVLRSPRVHRNPILKNKIHRQIRRSKDILDLSFLWSNPPLIGGSPTPATPLILQLVFKKLRRRLSLCPQVWRLHRGPRVTLQNSDMM